MLIMKYLDIGNEIYHGTLNNFDPKDINEPSWFTIEEEQSIKLAGGGLAYLMGM